MSFGHVKQQHNQFIKRGHPLCSYGIADIVWKSPRLNKNDDQRGDIGSFKIDVNEGFTRATQFSERVNVLPDLRAIRRREKSDEGIFQSLEIRQKRRQLATDAYIWTGKGAGGGFIEKLLRYREILLKAAWKGETRK